MVLDQSDVVRFWGNVNVRSENECWFWKRCCNPKGYGQFKLNGRMEQAHRVSWFLANGSIPELFEGLSSQICHSCDNPKCSNPNHLFLGNNKINMQDSAVKGRKSGPQLGNIGKRPWFEGVNSPSVLKTEVEIQEIKQDLKEGILLQKEIAKKHDLDPTTVSDIKRGKTWSRIK